MIEDIEDGKINCIITKDLSRLGRNYILTGQYTELYFPSKGVRYIAIHDGVDTIREDNDIKSKKNVKRPKEDWMRVEDTHEPLVDRETWDLVQEHINSRKRSRKDDEPQIFAGLLKCGECGWSLSAANTKNKSRYYRCTQYSAHGKEACSLHFITYNLLYAFVLGRLQT